MGDVLAIEQVIFETSPPHTDHAVKAASSETWNLKEKGKKKSFEFTTNKSRSFKEHFDALDYRHWKA